MKAYRAKFRTQQMNKTPQQSPHLYESKCSNPINPVIPVNTGNNDKPLIEPSELHAMMLQPGNSSKLYIMDVQAANSRVNPLPPITPESLLELDSQKYRNDRIKDAVYFGWRTDLCLPYDSNNFYYELPTKEQFEATLSKKGVKKNSNIVIYGDGHWNDRIAVRAYFVLKYFGHENVQILNGGINAWRTAGYSVISEDMTMQQFNDLQDTYIATNYQITKEYKEWLVDLEYVRENRDYDKRHLLVDSRPYTMYFGLLDAVAIHNGNPANRRGHIMGAVAAPWADYLGSEMGTDYKYRKLKSATELEEYFRNANILLAPEVPNARDIIALCNEGLHAAFTWFALKVILKCTPKVLVYEASTVEWANQLPFTTKDNISTIDRALYSSAPYYPMVTGLEDPPKNPWY